MVQTITNYTNRAIMDIENLISGVITILRNKFDNFCKNNQEKDLAQEHAENFFGIAQDMLKDIF